MVNAKLLVLSGLLAAHGVTGSAKNQDTSLGEGKSKNKTEIKNTPKETLSELDAKTIQLLVFFEGCSKEAYQDCVGVWTVGIGNTKRPDGSKVTSKDKADTPEKISQYVQEHLKQETNPVINRQIKRSLKTAERAALTSLIYNCGPKVLEVNGRPTALARAINSNDTEAISRNFLKYCFAGKKYRNELAVRRYMELAVYKGLMDVSNLYVCSYGAVKASKLTINRRPKFDKATLDYVKEVCTATPDAEKVAKLSWFGYGKKVAEFYPNPPKTFNFANSKLMAKVENKQK